MAHHKSAKKRIRQNEKRRMRNRHVRTNLRSSLKRLDQAIADRKADEAQALLKETVPVIDKTASKGVIHKNKASRHVSRLTRKVNALLAASA